MELSGSCDVLAQLQKVNSAIAIAALACKPPVSVSACSWLMKLPLAALSMQSISVHQDKLSPLRNCAGKPEASLCEAYRAASKVRTMTLSLTVSMLQHGCATPSVGSTDQHKQQAPCCLVQMAYVQMRAGVGSTVDAVRRNVLNNVGESISSGRRGAAVRSLHLVALRPRMPSISMRALELCSARWQQAKR